MAFSSLFQMYLGNIIQETVNKILLKIFLLVSTPNQYNSMYF